jgi:hypothetical protein
MSECQNSLLSHFQVFIRADKLLRCPKSLPDTGQINVTLGQLSLGLLTEVTQITKNRHRVGQSFSLTSVIDRIDTTSKF